jgi:hypothetical protein
MAYTSLPGMGAAWPASLGEIFGNSNQGFTSSENSATGAVGQCGFAWWPDGSTNTKSIAHVWWQVSSRTINAASQFRFSIQGVSLTVGPPMQPNGIIAASYTAPAGTLLTANAYNRITFDAPATVTRGQLVSAVFDWATWVTSSTVTFQFTSPFSFGLNGLGTVVSRFSGTYQVQTNFPNVVFEFTDGTFGTLFGTLPVGTINLRSFASSSTGSGGLTTGDERGLEFTPTVSFVVDGVILDAAIASTSAGFDIVVYEGTTAILTVSGDNNVFFAVGDARRTWVAFPQQVEFKKNILYRVMMKALSTGQVSLRTVTIATAGARSLFHGVNATGNSRSDGGAFGTGSTTELPWMMFTLSSLQGGSGLPTLLRRNQVD